MARTAEDRARAVLHQNEVGDVDWKLVAGLEGMGHCEFGVKPELLRLLQRRFASTELAAFDQEGGKVWAVFC